MTREEAIKVIKKHYDHWQRLLNEKICTEEEGNETIEAFSIAIKELKAHPDTDYKTLLIKLENAEDVIRGLKEDLRDAKEELRQRGG